jgi:hypothetical protein
MKFGRLLRLVTLRDLRSLLVGLLVVVGGVGLSILTIVAHRSGEVRLAGLAAFLSLVFVLLILIFVIPPLARNANAEVAQMDLPMDLTLGGLIFFALLIVIGFAAWNTGNNLLFLVLAFFISAFIIGAVLGSMSIRGLDVKLRMPEFIFSKSQTPIAVTLVNRKKIFPTYSVLVELRGRDGREGVLRRTLGEVLPAGLANRFGRIPLAKHSLDHFLNVPRKSEAEHRTSYVFEKRGRFQIRDFELSTTFPFGLLRHRRRLKAKESEILIYPVPMEYANTSSGGSGEVPASATDRDVVGELRSIREYQPADDVRTIEWKATARTGRLMVRETGETTSRKVTVWVDTTICVEPSFHQPANLRKRIEFERDGILTAEEMRFEALLSKVASLISSLSEEQANLRLVLGDHDTGFGSGKAHLHEMFRLLASTNPVFMESTGTGSAGFEISPIDGDFVRFTVDDVDSSHVENQRSETL